MAKGKGFSLPVEQSLDELDVTLPNNFVRVHRSSIVNKDYISEWQRMENGKLSLHVDLLNVLVSTSRVGAQKLKQLLNI